MSIINNNNIQDHQANENENHLIGNILAEDNSDSDHDDSSRATQVMGGSTHVSSTGISGGGNNPSAGGSGVGTFGTAGKLGSSGNSGGGFGGSAAAFGIGATAHYGGAFNNPLIVSDRTNSGNQSDLSKYYGHESPQNKKMGSHLFGLQPSGSNQQSLSSAFQNMFQPQGGDLSYGTQASSGGEPMIRRPSNIDYNNPQLQQYLQPSQHNSSASQNQQQQQNESTQDQTKLQQQQSPINISGQTTLPNGPIPNPQGGQPPMSPNGIYNSKEYYDYYHNLQQHAALDPRLPSPIYKPEGGLVNSSNPQQSVDKKASASGNNNINTDELEKKLGGLSIEQQNQQQQQQNIQNVNAMMGNVLGGGVAGGFGIAGMTGEGQGNNQQPGNLGMFTSPQQQQQYYAAALQQQMFQQQQQQQQQQQSLFTQNMLNPQTFIQQMQQQLPQSQSNQQSFQKLNQSNQYNQGNQKQQNAISNNQQNNAQQLQQQHQGHSKGKKGKGKGGNSQQNSNNNQSQQDSSNIGNNPNQIVGPRPMPKPPSQQNQNQGSSNINQSSINVQKVGGTGFNPSIGAPQIPQTNPINLNQSQFTPGQSIQQNNLGIFGQNSGNLPNTIQIGGLNQQQTLLDPKNNQQMNNTLNQGLMMNGLQQWPQFQNNQNNSNVNPLNQALNPNLSQNQSSFNVNTLQNVNPLNSGMMMNIPSQQMGNQQSLFNQNPGFAATGNFGNIGQTNQSIFGQSVQNNFDQQAAFMMQMFQNPLMMQRFMMNNQNSQMFGGQMGGNQGLGPLNFNMNMSNNQNLSQNQTNPFNNFPPGQQTTDNTLFNQNQDGGNSSYSNHQTNERGAKKSHQSHGNANASTTRGGHHLHRGGMHTQHHSHIQNTGNQPTHSHKSGHSKRHDQIQNYNYTDDKYYGQQAPGQLSNTVSQSQQPIQLPKSEFLEDLRAKIQAGKKIDIKDIKDHVVECSMDQYGSRFIQQKYDVTTPEEKDLIFTEILPEAYGLMNDVFGNYVVQKLFEYGTDTQRATLAEQLLGNVLKLTKSMYGCRVVQKALEVISLDQQRLLVQELKDAVLDCIYDQNGNHVIQKCIEKMPHDAVDFIVKAVSESGDIVSQLCVHTYGCRVIQRILENCEDYQTRPIIDLIIADIHNLTNDQFGNYVIQHILEQGKNVEDKNSIIRSIKGKVIELSNHKFASNVVEKCLAFGSDNDRKEIVDEILKSNNYEVSEEVASMGGGQQLNGALYTMMKDRYGNYVIQKCIEVSQGKQREILVKKITACANVLRKQANYSRHVYNFIEKMSSDGAGPDQTQTASIPKQKVPNSQQLSKPHNQSNKNSQQSSGIQQIHGSQGAQMINQQQQQYNQTTQSYISHDTNNQNQTFGQYGHSTTYQQQPQYVQKKGTQSYQQAQSHGQSNMHGNKSCQLGGSSGRQNNYKRRM